MSTHVEEAVEQLTSLPADLQRLMKLILEQDESATVSLKKLRAMQDRYISEVRSKLRGLPRDGSTDLRGLVEDKEAWDAMEELRADAMQRSDEKVSVARQAMRLVESSMHDIDQRLLQYEAELRAHDEFDSRSLPPGTQLSTMVIPGGIGSSEAVSGAHAELESARRMAAAGVQKTAQAQAAVGGGGMPAMMSSVQDPSPYPAPSSSSSHHHPSHHHHPPSSSSSSSSAHHHPSHHHHPSSSHPAHHHPAHHPSSHHPSHHHPPPTPPTPLAAAAAASAAAPARVEDAAGGGGGEEETYCYCNRPAAVGPMIGCDYDSCPVGGGWFHWQCVGIDKEPEGEWFCRECVQILGLDSATPAARAK